MTELRQLNRRDFFFFFSLSLRVHFLDILVSVRCVLASLRNNLIERLCDFNRIR